MSSEKKKAAPVFPKPARSERHKKLFGSKPVAPKPVVSKRMEMFRRPKPVEAAPEETPVPAKPAVEPPKGGKAAANAQ